MIRGTTAPFKFEVPYDTSAISAMVVKWSQKHYDGVGTAKLPLEKWYLPSKSRNDGFAFSDENPKEIQTILTEEETLRFTDKEKAYMQIRVQFDFGEDKGQVVRASLPQKITVYPALYEDQIGSSTPSEIIDDFYIYDAGTIR
jgi:hypothetical protein